MDTHQMIRSFHEFLRENAAFYELLDRGGATPRDVWKRLTEEMKRFAELFREALEGVERGALAFTAVKEFEVRSIDWMTGQTRSTAARLVAGEIKPGYAIEFIRDTAKSYIFTECFAAVRTDAAAFQERLIQAHRAVHEHKKLLLGIERVGFAAPAPAEETRVAPSRPKAAPSLLAAARAKVGEVIALPHPAYIGFVSLEECLKIRRSVHEFGEGRVNVEQVSQLLFAAQGLTDPRGFRSAPSAKAAYPLELHVIANDIEGLSAGAYLYDPFEHQLTRTKSGGTGAELARACHGQEWVERAPLLVAVSTYVTMMYGMTIERSTECGLLEAGHASQNLLLQACALELAATLVGEFDAKAASATLGLKSTQRLIYVICVGPRP